MAGLVTYRRIKANIERSKRIRETREQVRALRRKRVEKVPAYCGFRSYLILFK